MIQFRARCLRSRSVLRVVTGLGPIGRVVLLFKSSLFAN
jgi:hypothetical protein